MKIAVVTDSASDIPPEQARLGNIRVVPCIIVIAEQQYEDGKGLSRDDFYLQLSDMSPLPTTGAPSIGMFEKAYQDAIDQGYGGVVSIHPSPQLSGIFNSASAAAQSFDGKVRVIDSKQASMGLGYQVLAAAKTARQETTFDEIYSHVEDVQSRVRVLAMLDTLTNLRHSGRVSWMQAGLGSLLSIRMFIELRDGEVLRLDSTRTRRKAIAHLFDMIVDLPPLEDMAVLHSGAEEDAIALSDTLASRLGFDPPVINITTIIGTHVGPKGLGCAAVLKK